MRPHPVAIALLLAARLAAADNHCELTVSGDATATITGDAPDLRQGKLTAATDYWMSESQLRSALSTIEGLGKKLSKAEQDRKVDETLKKDPRFMLLMINCLTDEGGLIISASQGSRYASVPFKPATYPIVPTGKAKAGDFIAMVHLKPDGKRELYSITAPGKLVLSQFDTKGIAGTFTFKADSRGKTPKHVTFNGAFHNACSGDASK